MTQPQYYVGVLSGTSMDGVSAALVTFERGREYALRSHRVPYPDALREELLALSQGTDNEIERLGVADRQLGALFGDAVTQLLAKASLKSSQVRAIGSHGQTIRHRPEQTDAFSVQITDANTLAERTGIPVVADFRRRDIACGGEGAPLAPIFHAYAFGESGTIRLLVNIGGIANISVLNGEEAVEGFDCGSGNVLLDAWCATHLGKPYDDRGVWAASGKVHPGLLRRMQEHPFLLKPALSPPLSTGREAFNAQWLDTCIGTIDEKIAPKDVQATLAELTAARIATLAIERVSRWSGSGAARDGGDGGNGSDGSGNTLYVCGGGAHNDDLMERLRRLCAAEGLLVADTSALGIEPDWVEAMAFAWLAMRHIEGVPGNIPALSGASRQCVLGCLYPAGAQV